ncbi:tetratricopeptide repeat-containing sensor histidine kinase [Niabella drilacis]|uniref:Tetratricopeptide repeat-containing protein n=1 Tax=Niabella drilacis (strain DSM 25811 / CCM 8410 / CCUG 62505 / LMG 26954 / E90) TaxID=1285928 RepID=A0A1G6J536_NIADE|nr:tetratricopeptide repeat-containing sensor histidine kinase [Niabella drilacis]SDC13858.1 Tetratricopeptide repeat-containing protein [Niabella drilacis]
MKIFLPYGLLLLAGLLLFAPAGKIWSQTNGAVHMEAMALLNQPESKAKVDSIIAFTMRNRKNNLMDTLFTAGFELVKKLDYQAAEPRLLDAYGVYNRDFSKYALALANHKDSRAQAHKLGDITTEIHATNNIGVVYRRLDENGKALTYHMEALRLAEKVGDDYSASVSLNSIGNIHIVLGNYKDAILYFRKSLPIAQKANNMLGMAMNYNNIGEAYEYMGKLDSADKYYKESLYYNEKINNHKGIAISYNSIGNVLKKQTRISEAIALFEKAKRITDTLGDGLYRANNYNNLGNAYLLQKQYDKAKAMFFDALLIARDIGTMTEIKSAYEGLMKLNERTSHLDSALLYSKLFKQYSDSIVAESNNRHVRQMEAIYDTEKEKARIAFLEANREKDSVLRKNDRIFLFGALILFLLILTSGILYYLRYRLLERNKRLSQELEIRSQIASDLHDDMGSTLSSIHIFSELLRKSGTNKEELLTKIEANAKDTLDALDDIIWLVKPSNDKFSNLCQHIREYAIPMFQSKGIRFVIDFPDSVSEMPLPMDTRRNIFLIVKETVNNLVKYSRCTEASIIARNEDAQISFAIKDNGIGFDPDKLTDRNGIKNIKSRAGKINADIKIVTACGEGTLVEFWVAKDKPVYEKSTPVAPGMRNQK